MLTNGKRRRGSELVRGVFSLILLGALVSTTSVYAQQTSADEPPLPHQTTLSPVTSTRSFIPLPTQLKIGDFMPREFHAAPFPNPFGRDRDSAFGQSATNTQTNEPKRGVRKGMLALGIIGTVGVAAGVVAISESNSNHNCMNGAGSRQVCNDVHTLGEILIPTSAVVAGLGYFFAFRHAR